MIAKSSADIFLSIYIYMFIYICVCIYIYIRAAYLPIFRGNLPRKSHLKNLPPEGTNLPPNACCDREFFLLISGAASNGNQFVAQATRSNCASVCADPRRFLPGQHNFTRVYICTRFLNGQGAFLR